MSTTNTIEQAGKTLGNISHLRIRRGQEKTEVIFELESQAAKAVNISDSCTLVDSSGTRHEVMLVKVFFSQWAFRASGEVFESKSSQDEKSG